MLLQSQKREKIVTRDIGGHASTKEFTQAIIDRLQYEKNILENAGHGSLGHRIFCILRDKILNEEYEKGQKLNEVVLSKELNISRTPIREALKQLELEGTLLKVFLIKGVYVLGFSSRDIDDMLEIRVVLESLSVQLAIDRITQEELDRIKEIYDLLEFYAEKNDQERFYRSEY